jgi:hypothetical protein
MESKQITWKAEQSTTENPRVRKSGVMDGGARPSVLGGNRGDMGISFLRVLGLCIAWQC